MSTATQTPYDVAVVMSTVVRPLLDQAVRSLFAQRFAGRIQVLLGIDQWQGERALVEQLVRDCPSHMAVSVLDLGYSTSQRHGGLYPSSFGGSLRTVLSYAANSRYVGYLDDDNYLAPDHVASMLAAVDGKAWAFALRMFVDDVTNDVLCEDRWESVGPGTGIYRESLGGFVDTNCYLIDKMQCHGVFTEWAMTRYTGGAGGDRQVFQKLRELPWGSNGRPTVNYRVRLRRQHVYMLWQMKRAGVDLARYLSPADLPAMSAWARCAAFERGDLGAAGAGDMAPTVIAPRAAAPSAAISVASGGA